MDCSHGVNPAHLMRQARRSVVNTEEEVARPMAQRHRRLTAPAMYEEQVHGTEVAGGLERKAFRTKCKVGVRTLPSRMSMKIADLPEGWKVVEAEPEAPCPGWVAIEPRGYVLDDQLVPASPAPSPRKPEQAVAVPLAIAPRSARLSAPDP